MDRALETPGDVSAWPTLLEAHASSRLPTSAHLAGKRVLITGAAGSIGSALAHAAHASSPASLTVLDTSESGLYELDRALRDAGSQHHVPVLGSVGDGHALNHCFTIQRPEIVLHAAAYKHVPFMERNPFAAIENNALATHRLARIAAAHYVEAVVLLSTDKAADPLSIMGASKRLAELALLSTGGSTGTRMVALRLGNVLGTQGSVLPLFEEQIAQGRPLTVTHPDAQRYFMTMADAVAALLAALDWTCSPALLVPTLGRQHSIQGLARHLLTLHASDAAIVFTGLREGDKISESLLSSREHWLPSPHPNLGGLGQVRSPLPPFGIIKSILEELTDATRDRNLSRLLAAISILVPEYQPSQLLVSARQEACV